MATSIAMSKKRKKTRTSEIEKAKKRIEDVGEDDRITAVIYGRNKTGKTRWASDSKLKTLIIDCNERGTNSIRHFKPRVKKYRVHSWDDMDAIYWLLKSGEHDFQVIVIDTITQLAHVCMRYVLKEMEDSDFTRERMTPDKRSWGKLGEHMKDIIIKFRNLPYHIIILAQEKKTESEDEEGNIDSVEIHPELSPAPRSALLSAVDIIGRIYVTDAVDKKGKTIKERRMLLGPHARYVTGNRFDELKYIERNPTFGKFLKKIQGE